MNDTFRRRAALVATLALAFTVAGCRSHSRPPVLAGGPPPETAEPTPPPATATSPEQGPDVAAIEGEGATGADIPAGAAAVTELPGGPLTDVLFEYDSAVLTDAARAALEKHAAWLQGHRDAKVTVEGHCDERGTVEYNLALGEQRARAARDYLVSLGVAADRLKVVSFGKERPLDPAPTEEAYAKNRRAHFALGR